MPEGRATEPKNRIASGGVAERILHLEWESGESRHADSCPATRADSRCGRPPPLLDALPVREKGKRIE